MKPAPHTVFHNGLLLVRGTVQRRSPRSVSITGVAAWPLADLAALHREQGLDAVAAHLSGQSQDPAQEQEPSATTPGDAASGSREGGRRIQLETGYEMHPWSDLQPPGQRAATGRSLWHASPGSPG